MNPQLQAIRSKLGLLAEQKVFFCSFSQDKFSTLNSKEGRQRLKDVGISTPLEVEDWLVETFRSLEQEDMAQKLRKYFG